eukprot:m.29167 g.29167  ORF g.29167 m.29167 type:complete len:275 (+) comp31141_c0_seq4:141-965(+)
MEFEEEGLFADDDDAERPPVLPPLSPGQIVDDLNGRPLDGERVASEKGQTEELPKPKVRKPMIRLNATRIIDRKRGLPRLVKDFSKIKFRGKGQEAADIQKLIKEYELWANRLFPKYQFDHVLLKIEGPQGSKSEVKECMRKLRRGEKLWDEEVLSENEGGGDRGQEDNMADFGGDVRMADVADMDLGQNNAPSPSPSPDAVPSVSEEAMERMRQNREEALARLKRKRVQSQEETIVENTKQQLQATDCEENDGDDEDDEDDPLSPPPLVIADC